MVGGNTRQFSHTFLFHFQILESILSILKETALLGSLSRQLISAARLGSLSRQLISAAHLSSSARQLVSAALLGSSSGQLVWAGRFGSSSGQVVSAARLGSSSGQCRRSSLVGGLRLVGSQRPPRGLPRLRYGPRAAARIDFRSAAPWRAGPPPYLPTGGPSRPTDRRGRRPSQTHSHRQPHALGRPINNIIPD